MTSDIASVSLPDGERIPKLGQGTWEMGERPARRAAEIDIRQSCPNRGRNVRQRDRHRIDARRKVKPVLRRTAETSRRVGQCASVPDVVSAHRRPPDR